MSSQRGITNIPKEWHVTILGNEEIFSIIMGQSPPSSTYHSEQKGLLFLQGKMEFGEILPSPVVYCSKPIKIAEENDILISVRIQDELKENLNTFIKQETVIPRLLKPNDEQKTS